MSYCTILGAISPVPVVIWYGQLLKAPSARSCPSPPRAVPCSWEKGDLRVYSAIKYPDGLAGAWGSRLGPLGGPRAGRYSRSLRVTPRGEMRCVQAANWKRSVSVPSLACQRGAFGVHCVDDCGCRYIGHGLVPEASRRVGLRNGSTSPLQLER